MGMAKIAVETRAEATGRRARPRRLLLLAVVAAALIGGVWKLWELRRYRRAMVEIKQEIRAGRHGHAARKAAMLLAWKPDSDEATYLLGVCEKARGQAQAAFRAWERVSPGSPFGARAIQGRMELLIERGRLADAETLINQAMADPRSDGSRLGLFLGLVYSLQGRVEEQGAGDRGVLGSPERGGRRGIGAGHPPGSPAHPDPDDRGGPRVPRSGRTIGPGRRPGLAGEGQAGDPRRLVRRGRATARSLFTAASRRCPGLARPAGLGAGDPSPRRRAPGAAASAGRGVDSGPGPQADRLARRVSRRSRRGAAGAGTPGRRSIRPISPLSIAWRRSRKKKASRIAPASTDAGRPRSAGSRRVTKSSTSATRRCATPGRWPAWRSDSAGRSRRRSSRTIAIAAESEHGDAIVRSSQNVPASHPRTGTLADLLADELAAADLARSR